MKHICAVCGYVYDDEKEKIPFSEVGDDFVCPLCKAPKSEFRKEEDTVKGDVKKLDPELEELSVGQLAAVCSNLARGCEKQYKSEEAELFRKLSAYFTSIVPAVEDATTKRLADLLKQDIEDYPEISRVSLDNHDRGSARVCVWGEKVTRMLSSLVNRYLIEGEKMLEGQNVYVCTVCGFVYIGDEAPELCPVCKVPDWKFEKIEGRM